MVSVSRLTTKYHVGGVFSEPNPGTIWAYNWSVPAIRTPMSAYPSTAARMFRSISFWIQALAPQPDFEFGCRLLGNLSQISGDRFGIRGPLSQIEEPPAAERRFAIREMKTNRSSRFDNRCVD